MRPLLIKPLILTLCISAITLTMTGCGEAETIIKEKASVPIEDEHDHGGGEAGGMAAGRLLIVDAVNTKTDVYDLADNDLISAVIIDTVPSAVYATGGYRYAALIERNTDKVNFIDGGLWQEPHNDHFDLFSTMPSLSNFNLTGSRPTHFVKNAGQVAVFLDGDASTGNNAGVYVFDDHMIEEAEMPKSMSFSMPMHGVAEPRGEHIIASIRRDDSLSTSSNFILPDQVGVYHFHDDEYELEQTFDITCPDLHGAAQNKAHIVFGCSDGVLVITDNGNDTYSAQKLLNTDDVADGLRIGSLWGHNESGYYSIFYY